MINISFLNWFKQRWSLFLIIGTPLVLLPIPLLINNLESRCAYVLLILSIYWITEVIPLPVTSLLPLLLFPMTGVLSAEIVAPHYFKDIIALFFGSMAFGYAVESVNLHRRIALTVLNWVGTATKWIMAGLMGATAFLSMWMNNTASISIMLPVTLAILHELHSHTEEEEEEEEEDNTLSLPNDPLNLTNLQRSEENPIDHSSSILPLSIIETRPKNRIRNSSKKRHDQLKKGFLLGIAYSSSIGGLSSLVGTTPNIYLKGFVESKYHSTDFHVNFLNFLLFALPVGILMIIFCWIWLQLSYNREEFFQCRPTTERSRSRENFKRILNQQLKDLGKPKWKEILVGGIFLLLIILWITREFSQTIGWNLLFKPNYISDGTVSMFCGILPLILPDTNPFNVKKDWKYKPIVKWIDLVQNISWGSILLLGAGLAVATAFQSSKLSDSVAQALSFLSDVPRAAAIIIIVLISGFFTEVTSNLSTATIFFPVLDSLATSSGIHPAYLILPCTLAVSLAFMLPIATPPNAIVFASGAIRVIDMVKTGIVMNLVGFLIIFLAANTWMPQIFNLNDQTTAIFFNITSPKI